MRNIFDQYSQQENKLSHALACSLSEDRKLLWRFIRKFSDTYPESKSGIIVTEQQVPGQPEIEDAKDDGRKGLPDLWIYNDNGWALLIENKVAAKLTADQLRRHLKTAHRNGFDNISLLAITPDRQIHQIKGVTYITWPDVFKWMHRQITYSEWAYRFIEYMKVFEAKMSIEEYLGDKTLTEFDGIHFDADNPYNYREAKRVLRLMMSELRKWKDLSKIGMDPNSKGRGSITGKDQSRIWDFIPLKIASGEDHFTKYPHLTLSFRERDIECVVSVPHGIRTKYKNNLVGTGPEAFKKAIVDSGKRIKDSIQCIDKAQPRVLILQRRYPSQKSEPIEDARLEFDIRTAIPNNKSKVKVQDQWLDTAYNVLANKKNSNIHIGIGARIPYGSEIMKSWEILDVIANVWIGCGPLLNQMLK